MAHQLQEFNFFVVIDFEATCDSKNLPYPREIIEFPSVIVRASTGEVVESFHTYVRPTSNHPLTESCKTLTGIEQFQVDSGFTLHEALLEHDKWLCAKRLAKDNFAVVTWSDCDCKDMLETECRLKNIPKPAYFNRSLVIKDAILRRPSRGHTLPGKVGHRGLDDARNTALLLSLIMSMGFKLSITISLNPDDNDNNFGWNINAPLFHPGTMSNILWKIRRPVVLIRCGVLIPTIPGPHCEYFE